MALMIFPPDKMAPEFKKLLDPRLREEIASRVNTAILEHWGERPEAKIRQLIRARAWAESEARAAKVDIPHSFSLRLDGNGQGPRHAVDGDAMVS